MNSPSGFTTPRLQLRQWRDEDLPVFAAMNADPAVMEFFPSILTQQKSDELAQKIRTHIDRHGFGLWAVEELGSNQFIGFVGLQNVADNLPFAPAVEIGWRLAKSYWGRGLATEAARQSLHIGFEQFGLEEVVSFTTLANHRSQAVMQKLGMQRDAETFEHPFLEPGHPMREHCLYHLSRLSWSRHNGNNS